ncbi:hypothetical protein [Vulcanisaeta distributa]|uniref:Uncharacterized protein n=1 Tax=Vulcanisaeta distributa (strain DSM 14429 / JCM 11212 / NBRC 100878 / IC-017) TaxID=572478 RepID=E1QU29_VULDI|nr:hypothetical protein [Vulcanisaeta distributa]ADN49826.1 hypothetical protein Vdis_0425 [Vulcanisaeta distributa DSM 14429]
MRVAIALAILSLVITLIVLGISALTMGNLSRYVSANIYQTGTGYYLNFTIHNPLPLPLVITITQGGLSRSVYVEPYGFGSIIMPITSLNLPINITVSIPGIANVTSTVTPS